MVSQLESSSLSPGIPLISLVSRHEATRDVEKNSNLRFRQKSWKVHWVWKVLAPWQHNRINAHDVIRIWSVDSSLSSLYFRTELTIHIRILRTNESPSDWTRSGTSLMYWLCQCHQTHIDRCYSDFSKKRNHISDIEKYDESIEWDKRSSVLTTFERVSHDGEKFLLISIYNLEDHFLKSVNHFRVSSILSRRKKIEILKNIMKWTNREIHLRWSHVIGYDLERRLRYWTSSDHIWQLANCSTRAI